MLNYLATAWPFAYLSDAGVVAFAYVGMVVTLAAVLYVPFKLGRRSGRVTTDAEVIAHTSRALTGTTFDPFAAFGSPNLPGGINAR